MKTQEKYTKTNTSVKQSIRADKRNYLETLATEAQEAAHPYRTKDLYSMTKR